MILRSRKFWATLLGVISVLLLHFSGAGLPLAQAVDVLKWLVGVFIAATALEDGLKSGNIEKIADAIVHTMERRSLQSNAPLPRGRN